MLQKTKSKKGFTLAELLIVVAIIAVLTAIAVPLFVGAINKAEENVKNANIAAVREVAVVYILNAQTSDSDIYESGTMKSELYVKTTVSKTGEVGELEFVESSGAGLTDPATGKADKNADGGYDVVVKITQNDIKKKEAE